MKRLLFPLLLGLSVAALVAQETATEAAEPTATPSASAANDPTETLPETPPAPRPDDPRMDLEVDLAETPGAEDFEIPPPPDEADPETAEEITGLLEDEEEVPPGPPVTGTVEVTARQAGQNVTAAVGNLINITLESNPSTGFNWELRDFEQGVAGYHSADLVARQGGNVLFGAPADTVITLQALTPGTQDILLVYRRQWEPPDRVSQSFAFRLMVGEAPEGEASTSPASIDDPAP